MGYDTDKYFISGKGAKEPTYYILVSCSDEIQIYRYHDNTHTDYDTISISAESVKFKVDNLKYGFGGWLENVSYIDLSFLNTYFITNMHGMLNGMIKLEHIDNLSKFNTSNVTDMSGMFWDCWVLQDLDLYNFDTSKVTDMSDMFLDCTALTSLDLSNFDTSKVTDMNNMFRGCSSLTSLDVSHFDTSKVTIIASMFYNCNKLTSLDLSNWNTSKVTDMSDMFYYCTALTSLDLSNFDTSKVTDMNNMFSGCDKLTHIKCKQAFKDWCWTNQDTISLPTAMRNCGSGTWEIVN